MQATATVMASGRIVLARLATALPELSKTKIGPDARDAGIAVMRAGTRKAKKRPRRPFDAFIRVWDSIDTVDEFPPGAHNVS